MAYWLFYQEPEEYGYADLERDGSATWDGVANPVALKNLRATKPGDEAFFYHTGKEKAVVGIMQIVASPQADPDDAKLVTVAVAPVRRLASAVTLATRRVDRAIPPVATDRMMAATAIAEPTTRLRRPARAIRVGRSLADADAELMSRPRPNQGAIAAMATATVS